MVEEKATNEKEKKKERLESAKENLDRIQKTIKPFIKKNEVVIRSTTGKWSDGKLLSRQELLERVTKPMSQEDRKKDD